MSILQDIQKLNAGTLIIFYALDLSPCIGKFGQSTNEKFLWCDGVNELGNDITWSGALSGIDVYNNIAPRVYTRYPIQTEGFDRPGDGTIPRPKLAIANTSGVIGSLTREYNDLVGAKLVRVRTFLKYIDAVNFAEGNSFADPLQYLDREIWTVDRKSTENSSIIEWELTAPYDLVGVKLPRRQCIQNACVWRYRSTECGYTGFNYFDKNDLPIYIASQDVCGKRLSSCKARFGATAVLPFGGFPSVGLN